MLQTQSVDPQTLVLLKKITALPALADTRLVGGTALALQLGHRKSIDLDFFGTIHANATEIRGELETVAHTEVQSESKVIFIYELDGVKIDIVNYFNYPWLEDMIQDDGIRLASLSDIAAMKISAIIGRGTKKDFIDLAFLLHRFSLDEILDFFAKKYPNHSIFMAMKSLTYFEDAEKEVMPKMLQKMSWKKVKSTIQQATLNPQKIF
jgi:hypothetical protein